MNWKEKIENSLKELTNRFVKINGDLIEVRESFDMQMMKLEILNPNVKEALDSELPEIIRIREFEDKLTEKDVKIAILEFELGTVSSPIHDICRDARSCSIGSITKPLYDEISQLKNSLEIRNKALKLRVDKNKELEAENAKLTKTKYETRLIVASEIDAKIIELESENRNLKSLLSSHNNYRERMRELFYNDAVDEIIRTNRIRALNDLSQLDLEKYLFSLKKS